MLCCLLLVTVIPESLVLEARAYLRDKAKHDQTAARRREELQRLWDEDSADGGPSSSSVARRFQMILNVLLKPIRWARRRLFGFLEPLSVYRPRSKADGHGKDWSLTFLGLAWFCYSLNWASGTTASRVTYAHRQAAMTVKGSYLLYAYGWTSVEVRSSLAGSSLTYSLVRISSSWLGSVLYTFFLFFQVNCFLGPSFVSADR